MTTPDTASAANDAPMDLGTIEFCTLNMLPPELQGEALVRAIEERPDNIIMAQDESALAAAANSIAAPGMAVFHKKLWSHGRTIRVRFLDTPPNIVRARIEQYAREWEQHANVRLAFGNDPEAEIRITCILGKGSWSFLGTDALVKHASQPTMNFGWFTAATPDTEFSRTTLHEFGHALGCVHEHMHPAGGIPWNKDAAYRYYTQTQGWTKAQVDSQLFARYSMTELNASAFDPTSIMHYPVPKELTTNGFFVGWNTVLSETDKAFIRSQYPGAAAADAASAGLPSLADPSDINLTTLFNDNVTQLNILDVSAAGVVKGLLMELKRPGRDTYIRLRNAAPNGHTVQYDFVQGNRVLIPGIAEALGFASVTESKLTVHNA